MAGSEGGGLRGDIETLDFQHFGWKPGKTNFGGAVWGYYDQFRKLSSKRLGSPRPEVYTIHDFGHFKIGVIFEVSPLGTSKR